MPPELSVVIVNFNSGSYLAGCLQSLGASFRSAGEPEVVVVDNASTQDQTADLAAAEKRGARVLRLERNTGYAGGCNRGAAATAGPFVFLLNADVVVCPGALPVLARFLAQHPEVGLAEPRCFVDAGRAWRQPEFSVLTPREVLSAGLGRVSGRLARRRGLRALRRQLAGWRASTARECEALSGAFLATRREVLDRVGGLDEAYPLAFEDTDLFLRVREAGWKLALVPEAEAIHFGHRSRITVLAEAHEKHDLGRRRFLRAHHGRAAEWLDRATERFEALARRVHVPRPRDRFVELGSAREPLALELEGPPGPFVIQLAMDPFFDLAVGHIGTGASYTFSPATWRSLLPAPYFARAFALESLAPRGAWSFRMEA